MLPRPSPSGSCARAIPIRRRSLYHSGRGAEGRAREDAMKTIEITQDEMQSRISRYSALEPLPIQQDPEIPLRPTTSSTRASCSR